MWLNTKPNSHMYYGPETLEYTVGVNDVKNIMDQKRNAVKLKPGHATYVKVLPRIVTTSKGFEALTQAQRGCKMPYEIEGFRFLARYTRIGCEIECATQTASEICQCVPWYMPNNVTQDQFSICDMFGHACFAKMLSDESNYKRCPVLCMEDCQETAVTLLPNILPIDTETACARDTRKVEDRDQQFEHSFLQHYSFMGYKMLIEGGPIPDLTTSFYNGSLCRDYVAKHIGFISIESPTTSIILSKREKKNSFYDQLGTIGGTLGLFTGMSLLSMVEVLFLMGKLFQKARQRCDNPYGELEEEEEQEEEEKETPKLEEPVNEKMRLAKMENLEGKLNVCPKIHIHTIHMLVVLYD